MKTKARVLIVEDDTSTLSVTSLLLKTNGYRVSGVGTGADALKLASTETFDLALVSNHLQDMDGVELEFEPEAVDLIASEAIKRKTGARALRSIVEEIMLDVMYEVPSKENTDKIVITAEDVKNRNNTAVLQLPTKPKMVEKEEDIA